MTETFSTGDRVRWNSPEWEIEGEVTKVHTEDVEFMGRMRRCSEEEPQFEVRSDATGATAMHKAEALEKIG